MSDTVKALQRLKRRIVREARRWERALASQAEGSLVYEKFRASAVWMRLAESWVDVEIRKVKR
jgi:hypothetical protein